MIRVVFYGTSTFSLPTLRALANDPTLQIVGVVTQPDRPAGRQGIIAVPPVKQLALERSLPIFQFEQVKADAAYEALTLIQADVAVVASFGQIISQRVLDLYSRGVLNVHPSLLPAYRGAIPMTAAIRDGLAETGITIMLMDASMDHGPILSQIKTPLLPNDTTETATERLSQVGGELLVTTLHEYLDGKIDPQEQDHSQATFVKLLSRENGKIDLTKSAAEIECLVRAYTPWPGTTLEYKGKKLKVLKAHVGVELNNDELAVTCGDGSILILDEVQPEGKKPMPGVAFLRGLRQ